MRPTFIASMLGCAAVFCFLVTGLHWSVEHSLLIVGGTVIGFSLSVTALVLLLSPAEQRADLFRVFVDAIRENVRDVWRALTLSQACAPDDN